MGPAHPQLDTFLQAWENHHRLRRSGAPISMLSASRARLDQLRLDLHRTADR